MLFALHHGARPVTCEEVEKLAVARRLHVPEARLRQGRRRPRLRVRRDRTQRTGPRSRAATAHRLALGTHRGQQRGGTFAEHIVSDRPAAPRQPRVSGCPRGGLVSSSAHAANLGSAASSVRISRTIDDRIRPPAWPPAGDWFGDQVHFRDSTMLAASEQARVQRRDVRGLLLRRRRSTHAWAAASGDRRPGAEASPRPFANAESGRNAWEQHRFRIPGPRPHGRAALAQIKQAPATPSVAK